jgi:PAS domain S-box-containing protein
MNATSQFTLPILERVIDRTPITVSPDTLLIDVISLISKAQGCNCALSNADQSLNLNLLARKHSSCVLVIEAAQLVGVLTERDVVKLTAAGVNLAGVRVAEVMTRNVVTLTMTNPEQTSLGALTLLRQHRIRHLPVLDAEGQLLGIITPTSIRQVLQPANLLRLSRVEEAMTTEVIHAPRTTSVLEIAQQMADARVSCIVITELAGEQFHPSQDGPCLDPLGIITERDIVQFRALELNLAQIQAETVMSGPLFCLHPSDSLWEAHQQMQARYVQRLVVAGAQGELVGIITQTSLLQVLDPLEIAGIVEALQQQVEERTTELRQTNQRLQQEIAERHQVEVALQDHQQRLQALFSNSFQFIGLLQPDGTLLEANLTALEFIGRQAAEVIGRPFWDTPWWRHDAQLQQWLRAAIAQAATGEVIRDEVTHADPNGNLIPFDFSLKPIKTETGQVVYLVAEGHEISDRKQTERQLQAAQNELERRVEERTAELASANAALQTELIERRKIEEARRESEERFQGAFTYAAIGMGLIAPDGRWLQVNSALCEILGYSAPELLATTFQTITHPDDLQIDLDFVHRVLSGELRHFSLEKRYFHRTGHLIWALLTVSLVRDAEGNPWYFVAQVQDITERRQAEQKIREQAALLDITTDAVFVKSLDDQILFWNQGAEKLFGWSAAEVKGQKTTELLYQDPSQLKTALKTVVEQGSWQGELTKLTKSGKAVIVESRLTLMRDAAGQPECILAVNTDITEKKQLEAQFLRVQRLESLGTLAGGIAHDLNNILAPILAVSQLVPRQLPNLDQQNLRLLKMAEESAKRGAALVRQILTFARDLDGKHIPIQVAALLEEIDQIIRSTFPKSINITRNVPTQGLGMVSADPTQLHQVLMNLCVNARDAIPNGGTISLSAEKKMIDQTYARLHPEANVGAYVVITVTDTGTGIPPEILDRIFDPFFTTKEIGKGTGLGLSTVIGIVKSHGGFINVYSEVGKGTSFKIYLPAIAAAPGQPTANLALQTGQGELILVVDDEAAVQATIKATLEAYNYRVLTARDGIQAIALYAQHQSEIQIVLLDMMMPSMSGAQVLQVLQGINPQVQIIAMSGLPASESNTPTAGTNPQEFLLKPFTAQELLSTLHTVLVESSGDRQT